MTNLANDQKLYEISYLLTDDMPEEIAIEEFQKTKNTAVDLGGSVQKETLPKKRRLAYQIKKQTSAYFANFYFYLDPSKIKELENKLKLEKNILRHLLTEVDKNQTKEETKIRRVITDKIKPVSGKKPEEKTQIEELDKKLEEILKKI